GQGDRCHRRVDVRARHHVARSELETCCDRSWAMKNAVRRLLNRGTGLVGGATLFVMGATMVAQAQSQAPVVKIPNSQMEPVPWAGIDGWAEDDHLAAFAAYFKSCDAILRGTPAMREARPLYGALYDACKKAADNKPTTAAEA